METLNKLMFAVRAKPGLTRQQALDHLRERHGPLVAASFTNRQRLKTYIQNHAVDVGSIPAITLDRDWIIESWRDLSVKLPEPPVAPDAVLLREDEARFPDRATLLTLQLDEVPVWQADQNAPFASAPIKIFTYAQRARSVPADRFEHRWAGAAEALASHPAFQRGAASFVRNIPRPGEGPRSSITAAPSADIAPPFDAVDIWRFASVEAVNALFADDSFREALDDYDNALFDSEQMFRLATREIVVFDDAKVDPASRVAMA